MRLIDADSLIVNMDKGIQGTAREYLKFFQMAIKDEPTAYDVDKVVERLERMRNNAIFNIKLNSQSYDIYSEIEREKRHYEDIISIVKEGQDS